MQQRHAWPAGTARRKGPAYDGRMKTQGTYSPGPLVVIAHASVGSGHRSAAHAIAEALELLRRKPEEAAKRGVSVPRDLEVEVVDILDFGRIRFDGNEVASLFTGTSRPVYDLTWRFFFTGRILWGGGTGWAKAMFPAFTEYLLDRRPRAVICTHITAANAAVGARLIGNAGFPVICVPTDYEIEGLWPHLQTDLFCVADERMAETLRARHVDESRLRVTGLPCRPSFCAERGKDERQRTRAQLGVGEDRRLALVLAGAKLARPYEPFRETIERTLPLIKDAENLHVAFIAGEDEAYARRLGERCAENGLANATVLGYVHDLAAVMSASDFAVCKAGGLTVTECLCARTPMLLVGRSYGQEKANARMLAAAGAAVHATTPRELAAAIKRMAEHPESSQAILNNAEPLRKPNAAADVAATAFEAPPKNAPSRATLKRKHFLQIYRGGKPAHVR